jgi:hypothetical protein
MRELKSKPLLTFSFAPFYALRTWDWLRANPSDRSVGRLFWNGRHAIENLVCRLKKELRRCGLDGLVRRDRRLGVRIALCKYQKDQTS